MKRTIYERINDLCMKKNITIAELERKANLGNGTIRRWDKSYPSLDKAYRVADILEISVDYLYKGEENKRTTVAARDVSSLSEEELKTINDIIDYYIFKRNLNNK